MGSLLFSKKINKKNARAQSALGSSSALFLSSANHSRENFVNAFHCVVCVSQYFLVALEAVSPPPKLTNRWE